MTHIRRSVVLILFLLSGLTSSSSVSPVLLFLSRQDQSDTLGYNLVRELPALVYREITAGRVTLWDSPEKQIRILPASLKKLEENSGEVFSDTRQLFIYELWDLDKKKGELKTIGFYFSNRTVQGEDVSYGFVEYHTLDSLFRVTYIPTNANGNCEMTFFDVLQSRYYSYNIVQIGTKKVTNVNEAIALKQEARSFIADRILPPSYNCKDVLYRITSGDTLHGESGRRSDRIIQGMEKYFNENMELYYNAGGDRLTNFIEADIIRLNELEVEERWIKRDEIIEYELISLRIPVRDELPLTWPKSDLQMPDLLIDFNSVPDLLNEKEFYFRIVKINDQHLSVSQSDAYLKGLRTWKWNQLTEFVRYE